ncbi:hypothetical protein Droror1_Dr00023367 [Drosera rotundifolia]
MRFSFPSSSRSNLVSPIFLRPSLSESRARARETEQGAAREELGSRDPLSKSSWPVVPLLDLAHALPTRVEAPHCRETPSSAGQSWMKAATLSERWLGSVNLLVHKIPFHETCVHVLKVTCKIWIYVQDLVPCVLISFENEHILMWRGRDWKSSFGGIEEENDATENSTDDDLEAADSSLVLAAPLEVKESAATPMLEQGHSGSKC